MRSTLAVILISLAACGNDNPDGRNNIDANTGPDAKQFRDAPPTMTIQVTVSGQATELSQSGSTPVPGITIDAFRNSDETTPVATTTTDAQGNYSITIQTMGESVDGYLRATKSGYLETYLYPPYPLMMDFNEATVIMVTQATFDTLSVLANGDQVPGKALIALVVTDGTNPVAGAAVSSTPTASVARYNAPVGNQVLPSATATSTHTDGIGYLFNVAPGEATVSATKSGSTFQTHGLKARPDVLTTTVVVP